MRFLADESCDFAIVAALRGAGEDVFAVAHDAPGAEDERVLELARKEGRILLTEDKDFGTLVFADGRPTGGVVFLRYPVQARARIVTALVQLVQDRGQQLGGAFTVIEPGRIRISPSPQVT
jgi:predicted nuclease of predicted toxin-antitoxin system